MLRPMHYLVPLACAVLLGACQGDDPVSPPTTIIGSGITTTEARTLPPFHSVDLQTVGAMNVTQGASQSVSVTVDDNVIDYITTTVDAGVLHIGTSSGARLSDFDLTVDLSMINIERLELAGVGSIHGVNAIRVDSLSVLLSGVGSIDLRVVVAYLESVLSGVGSLAYRDTVSHHAFALSGDGSLAAFDLLTDSTTISIGGQGTAAVTARELLDVDIAGSGTVSYKGHPTVNVSISGNGQVTDAN